MSDFSRSASPVPIRRFDTSGSRDEVDAVVGEEPLEIRIKVPGETEDECLAITMRTPGHEAALSVGFLFSEGVICPGGVLSVQESQQGGSEASNTICVSLRDLPPSLASLRRNFSISSSCGVCGKTSLEALHARGCRAVPENTFQVSPSLIRSLPQTFRSSQPLFERTGGLHAAALFSGDGELVLIREDVGRHNAVDKVLGEAFLSELLPLSEHLLMVSGRTSFEIIQKAAMGQIPVVVAVSAPSNLAIECARRFNQTLIGFVRDDGFNVYAGAQRVEALP